MTLEWKGKHLIIDRCRRSEGAFWLLERQELAITLIRYGFWPRKPRDALRGSEPHHY